MLIRFLSIALLAVSLTACSSNKEGDVEPLVMGERENVSQGPLDGTEGYGGEGVESSAVPGSQQDLVVNVGDRVFFGYDRYDLAPEARDVLDAQAQWLGRYPSVNVTIEGHSDERGTREYNLALGERRASSVKNYLTSMGVDPIRINTISYGKERPAVIGANPGSWAQNRRGVTRVE
ncbi:MAG: peptidoglycan-associated lipoprotein Pal [Rhodospirillales bacterium]|nr:peptidoglycan-associated lipoprotein Pal [Alphaproteobacteria bacterium]USO03691.1 MAG: peptidoglycan-associated lipoprotein Pal [Rhodospirillales bacterium]